MEIVGENDALEVTQPQALDGFHALHLLQGNGLLDDGVLVQVRQSAVQGFVLRWYHLEKKKIERLEDEGRFFKTKNNKTQHNRG